MINEALRIDLPCNACEPTMILTMYDLENEHQWKGFFVVDPYPWDFG